jgi:hypothetical protein
MQRGLRRLLKLSLLLASASTQVIARTPAAPSAPAPPRNLSEFEGLYEYRDGGALSMVASGELLVAIIGEGKYPLRAAGVDTFTNPGGDPIRFLRDADGRIVAFAVTKRPDPGGASATEKHIDQKAAMRQMPAALCRAVAGMSE